MAKLLRVWTHAWCYSAVLRIYSNTDVEEQEANVAVLCARKYPQRFMEFLLHKDIENPVWNIMEGLCACGSERTPLYSQTYRALRMRGKPWSRLPCAMRLLGIQDFNSEFSAPALDTVRGLMVEAQQQVPRVCAPIDYEAQSRVRQFADLERNNITVIRARGLLYALCCLRFGLPERFDLLNEVFAYHAFDECFQTSEDSDTACEKLYSLCQTAAEKVADYQQMCSDLVERVYRVKPPSVVHEKYTQLIQMHPSLVGANLDAAEEIFQHADIGFSVDEQEVGGQERYAILLARTFGRKWRRWIKLFNSSQPIGIHDAAQILFDGSLAEQKALGNYLIKYIAHKYCCLQIVARHWNNTDPATRMNMPPAELARQLAHNRFPHDGTNIAEAFATEASQWNLSIDKWETSYAVFLESQGIPQPAWCNVVARCGNYKGYFLSRSDVRGMFLGEYTNCCQHPGSSAASCSIHGQSSDSGAFFVIADRKDEIIAQSWVWQSSRGICFDSIESKGLAENIAGVVRSIYYDVANKLLSYPDVHRVTTGYAHTKAFPIKALRRCLPLTRTDGYTGYTDAKTQYLLASRRSAKLVSTSL